MNQRLCEIRNQSASAAIVNLDLEFRLEYEIDDAKLSEDEIDALRQKYARDLAEDKKFVFGKYVISENNDVRSHSFLHR